MTTTRRATLQLLGTATAALAVAPPAAAHTGPGDRVPAGLRPGGELDRLILDLGARDVFSGTVLVTHRGRTVLSRSCGMADKSRSIPNGPDTLYGLMSVAKLFTAVAIAQLAQRGRLTYLDTVGMHLDGFAPEVADRVTIHHLLTHTSGLGDPFGDPGFWEVARTWTSAQQQTDGTGAFVRRETLAFTPGAGSQYSNSAYHTLAEIVAKVSGQSFHDYVTAQIFQRAGMDGAGFYTLPHLRAERRIAHGYYRPEGATERVDNIGEQLFGPGAFATCAAMARFAHALWEQRLLDPAYTELTLGPKLPMPPPPGPVPVPSFVGYGPGATLAGNRWSYGHTGGVSNGGVGELMFYPDSGYVTMIMSNYEFESIRGIPGLARRLIVG